MKISELVNQIIPPNTREFREGFSNEKMLDNLSPNVKVDLEDALIEKFSVEKDVLIIETFGYLKSQKALPLLIELLEIPEWQFYASVAIFQINKDPQMVDVAINAFKRNDNPKDPYREFIILRDFYTLIKCDDKRINELIEQYVNDPQYLVSYNAKRALSMMNK